MLLRLVLIAALIGTVIWLWRKSRRPTAIAKPTEVAGEPMQRCARCGVHVPQRLAISADQLYYCSQAHLQQGPGHSEQ
jgi:uncharacterized protein